MTEDDARAWIGARYGESAVRKLAAMATAVIAGCEQQNLVAPSTIPTIWVRHILDSAQLVPLAPAEGLWVDIGTGAGFPGLVAAILRPEPTLLIEPRRQRVAFLRDCTLALNLDHVDVRAARIESIEVAAAVISARAVAPVEKLLQAASGCATKMTRWLLPRGRAGPDELAMLRQRWKGLFHMKQSLTDAQSRILICDGPLSR